MADRWPFEDDDRLRYGGPYYRADPPRATSRNRRAHSNNFIPQIGPNNQVVVVGEDGHLLPYDDYSRRRSSSASSNGRPAPIIIKNQVVGNTGNKVEDERPASGHSSYYEGYELPMVRRHSRSPSMGRPRYYMTDDGGEYVIEEGRRIKHYPPQRPWAPPHGPQHQQGQFPPPPGAMPPMPEPHHRSREDEDMIRKLEDEAKELKRLKEIELEKQRRKEYEEKLLLEQLEKEKARKAREAEDKKMKEQAIEEWKEKERKDKEKKQAEKDAQEAAFVELLRTEGYSEAEAKKRLRRMEKRKEKGTTKSDEEEGEGHKQIAKPKPTYIKVHSRYISPDTLDVYEVPWEFDDRDAGYIIIKRWVDEREQEILFNHTKSMQERRLPSPGKHKDDITRLVVNKEKPRKKSPIKRTSWFLT